MVADLSAVALYGFSSILMLNLSEPMHNAGVRKWGETVGQRFKLSHDGDAALTI